MSHLVFPLGTQGANGPLAAIARQYVRTVPYVIGLGLLASLLEGIGIGLLIPMLSLLMAPGSHLPDLGILNELAELAASVTPEARFVGIALLILLLIILKGIVQAGNAMLIAAIEGRASRNIRNALADKLLSLDYTFFLVHDRVRLVKIISTDVWLQADSIRWVLSRLTAMAALLVFGILLTWIEPRLTLVVLLGVLAIRIVLHWLERKLQRLSVEIVDTNKVLAENMFGVVEAMRAIRIFNRQDRERTRFAAASEDVRKAMQRSRDVSARTLPAVELMIAIVFLLALLVAYWLSVPLTTVIAFLVLLSRAQPQARTISEARLGISSVEGSVREVEWLLSHPGEAPIASGSQVVTAIDQPVRFENVTYDYPDGGTAVSDVSVTIRPGVRTALIGRSGCGKTTLANLLCHLIEPRSGTIYHGDTPINAFDLIAWRSRIALAGQDIDLIGGTIADNIAYGRADATREEIEQAAKAAGVHEFISTFPEGYDHPIALEGLSLSGGQRQRIGLARALLTAPDLLILDEATSAVDSISEREMLGILNDRRQFRTALVISHRKSTLAACDDGIVMENGRIVESGPLRQLDYYREMSGDAEGRR